MSIRRIMKERIAYLCKQYFYNKCSYEEFNEFLEIVKTAKFDVEISKALQEVYDEMRRQDPSFTFVDVEGNLYINVESDPSSTKKTSKKTKLKRLSLALSTAAVILVVAWYAYHGLHLNNMPLETTKVEVIKESLNDEKKLITLSDGSKVWINGSSRIEYPQHFDPKFPREVTLTGEAFFEVEKASKWPFVVKTGNITTKVLGTSFNIKAYPGMNQVVVGVKSGKVKVTKYEKTIAVLEPNQELSVAVSEEVLNKKERILEDKIAGNWKNGYLEYEDEPIKDILLDLERVYQTHVQLDVEGIEEKEITLSTRVEMGINQALDIICKLTDTELRRVSNGFIIYKQKKQKPM